VKKKRRPEKPEEYKKEGFGRPAARRRGNLLNSRAGPASFIDDKRKEELSRAG